MIAIKSKTKHIINKIQAGLHINVLSEDEEKGQLNGRSFLKLFKGSALMVPFSIGRTIRGVRFDKPKLDPFSICLEKQNIHAFNENIYAKDFCDICDTETTSQVRDFINIISNKEIASFPSWTIVYPWEENSFFDLKERYLKLLVNSRKKFFESSIVDENQNLLSHPYAMSHGIQFNNLISKIIEEGFDDRYPRPRVFILKNQNNWRWVMGGNGNHRAHIIYSMKYTSLPVSVIKVVDKSKSSQWNNVLNGTYTKKEAEEIFDIVFRGETRIRGCY